MPGTSPEGEPVPVATLLPSQPRRRPRAPRVVMAIAGVIALALVGSLVARSGAGSAGSSSAAGAADRLLDAVRNEDPVALASLIAPDEMRDVSTLAKSASNKGKSFKLTASASHPFNGVDLDIVNAQTNVVNLADGYAKVELTAGTFTWKINPAKLAPYLRNNIDAGTELSGSFDLGRFSCASLASEARDNGNDPTDLPVYCKNGGKGPFILEVREHGRWYVSPLYTGLEYWREATDLPAAEFGANEHAPHRGSATPEAAATAMANALGTIDIDGVLALLPPDEFRALYDYRAAIHKAIADSNPPSFLFSVDPGASLKVTDTKGGKKVVIQSASGQYNAADTSSDNSDSSAVNRQPWHLDGVCMTATDANGESQKHCASDAHESFKGGSFDFHLDAFFVDTVQRDGKWYVSPALTIADYARVFLNALKPCDVGISNGATNTCPGTF